MKITTSKQIFVVLRTKTNQKQVQQILMRFVSCNLAHFLTDATRAKK